MSVTTENSPPTPSVVVVTWNGGPLLSRCIEALRGQTITPKRIVVVVARPDPIPVPDDVIVIRCERPQGYAASANRGGRATPEGPLIVLNDDTIPAPDFVAQLEEASLKYGEGIYCPRIILADEPEQLDNTGHRLFPDGYNLARGRGHPVEAALGHTVEVGALSGAAFMLTPTVRERVGLFDHDLESFGEDLDLSLRARRLGYRIRYVDGAEIHHRLGASYGRISPRKIYLVERNRMRAALRSLPLSAIATMPAWTTLRLTSMGLSAILGRGPGAGVGLRGTSAALMGGFAGLISAPDAWRKRENDRAKWTVGEKEMWRHLLTHRVRSHDLLGTR